MATLTIHSCLPSLSTIDGHVCSRPCVIVSLLSSKQRLLSSRGPSLLLRGSSQRKGLAAPRASLGQLPGPEHVELAVNTLSQAPEALQGALTRAEGLFFTLADATAAVDASQVTDAVQKQDGGWLGGITNTLELALTFLKDGLAKLNVPYSYGFAIILLTLIVKLATYPLTKQQVVYRIYPQQSSVVIGEIEHDDEIKSCLINSLKVESTLNMQNLQPKIKAIQTRYKGDQERIQLETARLYKQAGVNPLAGCLPTLATLPIWIGLYRALSNVANEGLLTEGFFWIPSLAGPTTIAARTSGSGISWLFPFVDGAPPLGWGDTISYLVLPVLLIVSQYISMQLMQPPQAADPSQGNTQLILKFLPLMIGYFALSVPSGLSLYWLTNNILSTGQQVYLRQLGGAKAIVDKDGGDIISAGQAKRTPLPPSSSATASSTITTEAISAEDSRGQRFRQLKEEEAKKKEARRRAAEEASKAASAKAAEDREQIFRAQRAQEAQRSSASSAGEEDEQSEGEGLDGADSKEEALAANGAVGSDTGPNRSKRSKRRRAP